MTTFITKKYVNGLNGLSYSATYDTRNIHNASGATLIEYTGKYLISFAFELGGRPCRVEDNSGTLWSNLPTHAPLKEIVALAKQWHSSGFAGMNFGEYVESLFGKL